MSEELKNQEEKENKAPEEIEKFCIEIIRVCIKRCFNKQQINRKTKRA